MHFITFVPWLVVGAAARPALIPTTIAGRIPFPTLLSGALNPGNMFPDSPTNMSPDSPINMFPDGPTNIFPPLPIHPRKEAKPTSEPSFRSVTEEEDAAKAEDKKAKKAADDKKAKEDEFDVDAFIATLDTPSTDSKAAQKEALAGIEQKAEKRHESGEEPPAYPVRFDGEGEVDEEASVEALERYFDELDSKHKTDGTAVERRQIPDLAIPFSKMTPDLAAGAPPLWKNAPTTLVKPDLSRVAADGPVSKPGGLPFKRQMTGMPSLPSLPLIKRQFYDWNEKTIAQAEAKAKFHDEMQSQMNAATPSMTLTDVNAAYKVHVPVPSKPAPAGLDAMNEQLATLLDNLPIKRQAPEGPTADKKHAKNATSSATAAHAKNATSAASGFYAINNKLSALTKLPFGGLPIKRRDFKKENVEKYAKDDTSASKGFYGINDKLNKLKNLPIGKRQVPDAPTALQAKTFGNSLLDKYLVSLKNQPEQPAAATPSLPSEEDLTTVADDADLAALVESQPEIEESSPIVAEVAASSDEIKPEIEESSALTGLVDEDPEALSTPEVASLSEELPETEESSPLAGLAGEESAESLTPEAADSALEDTPETEDFSLLALDGLVGEGPVGLPATEELPSTEEAFPLASLTEEKPEDLSALEAAAEPKPESEESNPLAGVAEEKPEDLSALDVATEPKPATEGPLAGLVEEKPEDLSDLTAASEPKPETEEVNPLAGLVEEKPEDLSALTAASEPKPETEEVNPLAGLAGDTPEDLTTPAAIPELEPESSPLAGLTGEQPEDLSAVTAAASEPKPATEDALPLGEQPEDLAALTEPKPETEEVLPVADLTGEQPEAASGLTAAGGLPSNPKSDLTSSLAGLLG
jgi:hypothetical protein